jgi:hypothetical protein
VGNEPDGTIRPMAHWRRWLRIFLRLPGGETNQFYPAIYEGTTPVEPASAPLGANDNETTTPHREFKP